MEPLDFEKLYMDFYWWFDDLFLKSAQALGITYHEFVLISLCLVWPALTVFLTVTCIYLWHRNSQSKAELVRCKRELSRRLAMPLVLLAIFIALPKPTSAEGDIPQTRGPYFTFADVTKDRCTQAGFEWQDGLQECWLPQMFREKNISYWPFRVFLLNTLGNYEPQVETLEALLEAEGANLSKLNQCAALIPGIKNYEGRAISLGWCVELLYPDNDDVVLAYYHWLWNSDYRSSMECGTGHF